MKKAGRSSSGLSVERRNNRNGFLFALPWILGFLGFSVYPLVTSLYYSFTEFNPIVAPKWVGWANYIDVFSDPLVYTSMKNTLFIAFVSTPINLFIALILASPDVVVGSWDQLFLSTSVLSASFKTVRIVLTGATT